MATDAGTHEGQPHPWRGLSLRRAGLVPAVLRVPGILEWIAAASSVVGPRQRGELATVSLHLFVQLTQCCRFQVIVLVGSQRRC